ncbi:MAG: hypothetical protein IJX79_03280 [Clostridia bacterium]|nr:hypothetical protein [Clostridia bacterium]
MINDKNLLNALSHYKIENYSPSAKDKLKNEIFVLNIKSIPPFSMFGFLSGLIYGLTPWFFIISAFYLLIVFTISSTANPTDFSVLTCSVIPFLSISGIGCVYLSWTPQSFELESTCLYKPQTIFAGRLVLCGIYNICILLLSSALSEQYLHTVLLSLLCFLLSSVSILSMCVFFNAKVVIFLSTGIVSLFISIFFSFDELFSQIKNILLSTPLIIFVSIVVFLTLFAVFLSFYVVKNLNFEKLVKNYET